jgi:hypothetical protein
MGNLHEFFNQIDEDQVQIMHSKDKNLKVRYVQDIIDNIFKEEAKESDQNISKIQCDINKWARKNEIPINPSSTFIKRERIRAKIAKYKERETLLNGPVDIDAETDA